MTPCCVPRKQWAADPIKGHSRPLAETKGRKKKGEIYCLALASRVVREGRGIRNIDHALHIKKIYNQAELKLFTCACANRTFCFNEKN